MVKKILFLTLLILSAAGLIIWLAFKFRLSTPVKMAVAGKPLEVEIAKTLAQKEQGLSNKPSLCPDCGMLFLFDQPGIYPFWMRKMYFDIDILWIRGNQIADITYNAQKPTKEEFDVPRAIFQSQKPIDKVLEVNAGWAAANGIKVGDEVKY